MKITMTFARAIATLVWTLLSGSLAVSGGLDCGDATVLLWQDEHWTRQRQGDSQSREPLQATCSAVGPAVFGWP